MRSLCAAFLNMWLALSTVEGALQVSFDYCCTGLSRAFDSAKSLCLRGVAFLLKKVSFLW